MKIAVIHGNMDNLNGLHSIPGIQSVERVTRDQSLQPFNIVIVGNDALTIEEIIELRKKHPEKKMAYFLPNQLGMNSVKNIQMFCHTHHIHFIAQTDKGQLVNQLLRWLFPHTYNVEKGNKVVFASTHAGVGTTSIVHSVADMISKKTTAQVGVIHLNAWNEGLYKKNNNGKSIDEIYTLLKNHSLNSDQLFQAFARVDQFFVLQGNKNLKSISHYEPGTISRLLDMASDILDLVLIDVGSYLDGLSVQGMISGDLHYLVTTPESKGIHSFSRMREQILNYLQIDSTQFMLVVNKSSGLITSGKVVSQKLHVPLLLEIPTVHMDHQKSIDEQEKWLTEIKETELCINQMSQGLIEHYQLEKCENKEERGWFSSLFRAKEVSS